MKVTLALVVFLLVGFVSAEVPLNVGTLVVTDPPLLPSGEV